MTPEAPAVARGQRLELRVEKLVAGGLGLARHEGLVVLLPDVLPQERVSAEVLERRRDFARARPVAWLETGPSRRTTPCPHAAACGGCALQHVAAEEQATLKAAIVVDCLERADVALPGSPRIHACAEAGWRARAVLHARRDREGVHLGFFERGSHRVVDLRECAQLAPGLRLLVGELRTRFENWLGGAGIREIALACDGSDTQRAVELRAGTAALSALTRAVRRASLPGLASLGVSESRAGARYRRLAGDPFLEHVVGGVTYRAHVRSFFQANRFLVDRLVDTVVESVPSAASVVDLYAGVGLFSLALARRGQAVVAVESDGLAVRAAEENVARAGIEGCRIVRGDAARELHALAVGPRETVVLDPPRTGASSEVVSGLLARAPERIVYVSCDPATLARDLRRLRSGGYALRDLTVLDMFPTTAHVESVAVLER